MNKDAIKAELKRRKNNIKKELARREFYEYCKLTAYDFFKPDRIYLKTLCDILQKLYDGKLFLPSGNPAKKLMIAMPPRHGKTRTLTKYSAWVLGQNPKNSTIVAAYNDSLALEFSKFTRDEIRRERNDIWDIIYPDVFPGTRIRRGSSSMKQWAVAGAHFSYKGTGINGTVTGIGGDILLIDDPVKDAETAFNENALDRLWLWYTGTWLSRKEPNAIEIINHTPWSKKDISGRILDSEDAKNWYILSMPACIDEKEKKMLCSEILSYEEYCERRSRMEPIVFAANYDMQRLDKKGLMYREFTTYDKLPDFENDYEHQGKYMITDTAAQGEDYLCSIYGYAVNEYFYVIDVDYTQEDIDVTEEEAAEKIVKYKINTADIESNSAGHSWAYHVQKICKEKWKWHGCSFIEQPQTKNKEARIFTHNREVNRRLIFPHDWRHRWPDFYHAVMTYSKEGKNKHDDAPDTMTRVVEFLDQFVGGIVLPK